VFIEKVVKGQHNMSLFMHRAMAATSYSRFVLYPELYGKHELIAKKNIPLGRRIHSQL
jgi:hypothetical protein